MSRWVRLFSRRKRMMDGLDEDIRDFIELETQDNIDRGMPPEEARYAALRKFGNVTRVKEDTREVWSNAWLEQLWRDLRYGLRMLAKRPAFTAVAAMTIALGIASITVVFSIVNVVIFGHMRYGHPERMALVWTAEPRGDFSNPSEQAMHFHFPSVCFFQISTIFPVPLTGGPPWGSWWQRAGSNVRPLYGQVDLTTSDAGLQCLDTFANAFSQQGGTPIK